LLEKLKRDESSCEKKRLNCENAGVLRENLISLVRSVYKIVA